MTTTLQGGEGQRHAPAAIYPRERPGTHCTGETCWADELSISRYGYI